MSEKHPKRSTPRVTPPSRRRHHAGMPGKLLDPGADSRPNLPPPPARVRLDREGAARAAPAIGWPHMLVNGSDAEFRRMVRRLGIVMHRLDEIRTLAAGSVGLTGVELSMLLAVVEGDAGGDRGDPVGDKLEARFGREPGVPQLELARRLGLGTAYASDLTKRLRRAGMVTKRPDPANPSRRLVAATEAGRRAVEAAAPLIRAAHNVAFAGLDARGFERLCGTAAGLESGSGVAVDILARRTGEDLDGSIRELGRTARRLGLK